MNEISLLFLEITVAFRYTLITQFVTFVHVGVHFGDAVSVILNTLVYPGRWGAGMVALKIDHIILKPWDDS